MLLTKKNYLTLALTGCFALPFSACVDSKSEEPPMKVMFIQGLIDRQFVSVLEEVTKEYDGIVVGSFGGESNFAIAAAKVIEEKNLNVIIDGSFGVCTSGCAEYLLPAAKKVYFVSNPLIGYHQNPQIVYHLLAENSERNFEYCSYIKQEVAYTLELLKKKTSTQSFG